MSQNQKKSTKKLDVYSMMIVAKYFMFTVDFINIQQVCKKFEELNDFFHYNPIKTIQLFPNTETQYLYCMDEKKVPGMFKYMVLYKVSYKQYLKMKAKDEEQDLNVEYRYITYSDRDLSGNTITIPEGVTEIEFRGFYHFHGHCKFPSTCKVIRKEAFCYERFSPTYAGSIYDLNEGLRYIEERAFENNPLREIIIPESVVYIGSEAFKGCKHLKSVIILNPNIQFGNCCFTGTHPELECNIEIPKHAF